MTLILQGTDNSVSSPAVQGGTAGTTTGVYYPASNQIALAANGAQALLANSSQGVQVANTLGVGATTPSTSGAGITFPATQSASSNANTLDDYEEGSWTPTVAFGGTAATITYTEANYRKIGGFVWVSLTNCVMSSLGAGSGAIDIGGLPFAMSGIAGAYGYGNIQFNTSLTAFGSYMPFLPAGSTTSRVLGMVSGGHRDVNKSDFSAGNVIYGFWVYAVA